jgi:hypothetical protein
MPVLKDNRQVNEVKLPESGVTVQIKDGLLAGDVAEFVGEPNQAIQSLRIIASLITDWDAADESGQKLPVTIDTLKLLSLADLKAIEGSLKFVKDFLAQAAGTNSK